MIVTLTTGQPNDVLVKLSGEVPVYIGSQRETLRQYEEYRDEIERLTAPLLRSLRVLGRSEDDDAGLASAMATLARRYPFVELLYTLDAQGIQRSDNVLTGHRQVAQRGQDRSRRPYYQKARESAGIVMTAPYVSTATGRYCISCAVRLTDEQGNVSGYAVVDFNFDALVAFIANRQQRRWRYALFAALLPIAIGVASAGIWLLAA